MLYQFRKCFCSLFLIRVDILSLFTETAKLKDLIKRLNQKHKLFRVAAFFRLLIFPCVKTVNEEFLTNTLKKLLLELCKNQLDAHFPEAKQLLRSFVKHSTSSWKKQKVMKATKNSTGELSIGISSLTGKINEKTVLELLHEKHPQPFQANRTFLLTHKYLIRFNNTSLF